MLRVTLRLFVLIFLTSRLGANSQTINPLKDPRICGLSACELENEKFRYAQNVVYRYSYDSAFQTLFESTDKNDPESELFISALVDVTFPTKCQGQLKINSVRLKNQYSEGITEYEKSGPDDIVYDDNDDDDTKVQEDFNADAKQENVIHPRSEAFGNEIEALELRFDFRDGSIQEICPNSDEAVWVTNFKRGILSAFQNSMFRFDLDHKSVETDVSGKCEVSYRFEGSSNTSIHITKTKDISSCQNRNKFKSFVQTTPYDFRRSDISWWPIFNSSSFCKFSIDNFIYNHIECHEHHVLIPFSNEGSGAVSRSTLKLKLLSENPMEEGDEASEFSIETRRSMLYDHSFSPKPTHNEIKISREYLKQMCHLGFPNIQRDFPDRFVKFLAATKQLSTRGLQQLLARAGGICSNGRKHVLESLPFIGSVASVELMKDLITGIIRSPEMTPEVEEIWMHSMFYLPRPEESTISTMFSLIQYYEVKRNPIFVLIPSAVVHTYCKYNSDCRNVEIVMNVVRYLEEMANKNLAGNLNDRATNENLLVALKGIGNVGIVSKRFETILKDLMIDELKNDDVKLQAIQVFRKTNCGLTREFFIDIYQNFTQSVETRIASYLQFMKCPSYLTIKQVKTFFPGERVNQVGSFVWSHLTNLAKTSSPQKVELQGLLADNKLDDKFKMDFRKFSKNYEYSLFFDEYNFGLSGESNVIFSTESYLPRSMFFNGTINLFGNSMNPFEFNIRIQGMEKYIESIFGIDAPLNIERMLDKLGLVYDKLKSLFTFDNEIIDSILRSRRSSQGSDKLIESFLYANKYDFNKPFGYFEHKVFGNDMNFYPFEGFDQLSDIIKKLVPLEQMKNVFSKKEEIFIKSGTMVDIAYTVPMSSGFPLVLSGFGAYSLDMRYFGAINNKNVFETGSLDFNGKLKPSLSMELSTKMQVDLFHASTDVKVKSNVYSNYAVETDIKIEGNKYATLKVKLPQDRNDIFSIRSQLIGNIQNQETLLYGITDRYKNSTCTWPSVDDMLGLKVCIDYSLPDVSDTTKTYPSLVLSGPIEFDIHLDKADLSAKIFNFEYQWNKGKDASHGSITFETPNTKIPRQFSISLKTDPQNYNMTMGFINGNQTQTALGYVKLAPGEKSLDFSISINDKKHFSMEMSVTKKRLTKSRTQMNPKFMLIINDAKVAGMHGNIKTIEKNNVTQHDIDLKFETKKMASSANGHVIITQTSLTTKMLYAYKFSGRQEETIEIDTEMANRSQKLRERTEYIGTTKFVSSAYTQYNFASGVTFISSLGHVETKLEYNNALDLLDPAYTMTTKITLAKNSEGNTNSRTTFSVEVTRPLSNTDLKFHIKYDEHFKNGTEHNVVMLIRYSPKKEVIATGSVLIPRGPLFGVDARFTLSIPDMNSCSAAVMIKERVKKDYYIDINGEWFTGENIKMVGLYQDRTSNIKRYYKLKSLISSKLFEDINCNLKYSRDLQELKIKVQTDYKKKSYSLAIESSEIDPLESVFTTELNWAEYSYSLIANSSLKDIGRTKVEIHLDRIRDMHLEVWGTAKGFSKNFGIEFKWDANRDPSQKFILSYDFDKPKPKVYTGNVLISYPDRTLNGKIDLSNEGPYLGNLKLSWSADEVIDLGYSVGSEFQDSRKFWALVKVDTPFTGWRNNRVNGTLYQKDNLLALTFATVWAESQTIGFDFHVDYLVGDAELSGELKAEIQSTIKDIPIIAALLRHNQTSDKVDSEISFKHKNFVSEDYRTFSMKSSWKHSIDVNHKNVSGSIKFRSPFESYNAGALITKFSLTKDRELFGVIDVDIDRRLYSFAVEGYMKRLLDNMISFNLTTPIITFPYLRGNFGIREMKRYLIADLKTENRSLGVEVLFDFKSINDFDLKFQLDTPQQGFEKILAIGKIKEHTIHLEGAWNQISLGFKGIWHFITYNDFEYSYLVFTPIPHFEENGLVVKFIAKNIQNFDVESSFKIGNYKLGVKAFGEPRTQLINQLGLQKATYIREDFNIIDDLDSDETPEKADADIDLRKYYGVIGNFEICTVLWSAVDGKYEVQQVEDTYHGSAQIKIPKGTIEVKNKFVVSGGYDYFNRLNIITPFPTFKSIESNLKLKIPEKGFTARFDVGALAGTRWKKYGFKVKYALPAHPELKIHDVTLIILYPAMNSTRVHINSRLELSKTSVHLASITLDGFKTYLKLSGFIEQQQKDLDIVFNVMLKSPVLEYYAFDTYLRKRNVEKSNQLLAGFLYNENNEESRFDAILGWRENQSHIIDGDFSISSNVFPIQQFNTSVFITEGQDPEFNIKILYGKTEDFFDELKFNIVRKGLKFEGELVTPFKEYSNVRFNGFLSEVDQQGAYKARGTVFKNMFPHNFEGDVTLYKNLPIQAELTFKDSKEGDATLSYNLLFDDLKRSIKSVVKKSDDFISFESELYIQSLLDWAYNVKIQSSKAEFNEVKLSTTLTPLSKTQYESSFEMMTPWSNHFIENVNVSSVLKLNNNDGDFKLRYEISKLVGSGGCSWKWQQRVLKQDYQLKIFTEKDDKSKHFSTEIAYTNSSKTPTDFKFAVNVNSVWALISKATFDIRNSKDMSLTYDLAIPEPMKGNHKVTAYYKGSNFPPRIDTGTSMDFHVGYDNEAVVADVKTKGSIKTLTDIANKMVVEWGEKSKPSILDSDFAMQKVDGKIDYSWELVTPYYADERTMNLKANYFTQDIFKIVHTTIHLPESRRITVGDVAFSDLTNMKGSVNCSLPIFNLTWFDINFDFDTQNDESGKFIKATWPENQAILDSKSTFVNQKNHKEWKGTIKAELPLQSKHNIQIIYGLEEKPLITTGDASVEYNTRNIFNSHYTCKTEKTNDKDSKDIINLTLENEHKPLGMYYTHQKKVDKGTKFELNKRHLELFDLGKDNRFNITGEFTVEVNDQKQNYELVAIHPNRTIKWTSEYNEMDTKTHQSAKIELANDIWVGYKIDVMNHTKDELESQEVKLKISYPTRDVSIGGLYLLKDDSFDTDLTVQWQKKEGDSEDQSESEASSEEKVIKGQIQWRDLEANTKSKDHQSVLFGLKHPSFDKDITLRGSYLRNAMKSAKIEIDYDYTDDEDRHAKFSSEIKNLSEDVGYKNYTITMSGSHPSTDWNMAFDGSIGLRPNHYQIDATGNYKREYLADMELEMIGFMDTERKEIKIYRSTPNKLIDVYGITAANFPVYTIDGNYIDSPDYETSGAFLLNFAKKIINANMNFTEDASHNLQVQGSIPDTRSASFKAWRNYDDVQINDISYFVQMNHSRLITSKLLWRPKIRKELEDSMKNFMSARYKALGEELDYWVKTIYSEIQEIIRGVLIDSKPYAQEFINDFTSVKDIDEDLSAFKNFLNDSYYADDFYIQSFMNYTMTVLDELAITDHLQTIPKIFKEMWEVLGESSKAFKNSILWIINTIKASYKESLEMFNQLLEGSSLDHITKFLEGIIEKYDAFVKDLHATFINYVETMWDNMARTIAVYWNRVLQNIEPQIIRSIHYIESVVWGVSTEIFDFMYNRTNELIESPYFTKVSNITHDLDVLYQDLQNNDMFTNVRKYSGVIGQFLKEKFLSMVPFGREIKDIFADISNEFKELQKIDAVRDAVERYEEIIAKITWLMNEFQFDKRLNMLIDIAKNKLTRITQNALQTEDVYREAKTKFIFDPDTGKIEWEQKLPMAWHAFNETPQFEEVPEYKLLNDIQTFVFSKKNNSMWNLYYGLKPLSEPQNFFPPFKSHALLIGSRHVITYDNNFVNFDEKDFGELNSRSQTLEEGCSYLLAHDFIDNRFSLILKPSTLYDQNRSFLSKTFVVQTGDEKIEIELGNPAGSIHIGNNITSILPTSFGDLMITRELNVVTVSSRRGIVVRCNLEFDVCSIELSGWHFGKIAGVLGTMNNEKFDDLTMSDNEISNDHSELAESWKLPSCSVVETKAPPANNKIERNQKICDVYFKQKTSYFATCFTIVDPDPFHEMCLSLGTLPRYQISSESSEKAACTAGIAYIEACTVQNVPLRVPDTCIQCKLPNGTQVSEGTFSVLKDDMVVPAVDVVFLIESRPCNMERSKKALMLSLVSSLASEFKHVSIDHQRFAVVTFGGSDEFSQPRSITSNGNVFTSAQNIPAYFNHLREGEGTSDVFTAITSASKLIFKPGAVKIFVLSLCSKCEFNMMKFDLKSVSQLLRESDITLHVMSNNTFNQKRVLGVDNNKAFIRKDQTKLLGDEALKSQVTPIKALGQCGPLALETDGSIFSSNPNKKNDEYKIIANVFAKRIVQTAKPKPCHFCECEGHNSGTAYMTCVSCEHQGSMSRDYDVDETLEQDDEDSYEDEL